jgi:hypothetical protein
MTGENEFSALRKTVLNTVMKTMIRFKTEHIVTCISIARQRLGKHIPAEANAHNRTSITRQRINKHTSLTIEEVFSAWSVQNGYKEVFRIDGSGESNFETPACRNMSFRTEELN